MTGWGLYVFENARRRMAGAKISSRLAMRRAQYQRARNHSRFSLGGCHRRARTPSLMLRPNGLAPARHHWFANVPPGVPFATPARESRRALLECHRVNPPGHGVQRLSGAQVSAGNLVAARLDREAVSAASFRFSALHETVRTHSQDRQ